MLFFSALNGSRKIGKPLFIQCVKRQASTLDRERDRISTEGTRYEGVCREAHKHNRNENWRRYVYLQRYQSH